MYNNSIHRTVFAASPLIQPVISDVRRENMKKIFKINFICIIAVNIIFIGMFIYSYSEIFRNNLGWWDNLNRLDFIRQLAYYCSWVFIVTIIMHTVLIIIEPSYRKLKFLLIYLLNSWLPLYALLTIL